MNNYVLNKKLISTVVIIFLSAIFVLSVLGGIDVRLLFAINMGSMIFIIVYCQFSLMSIFALLINFTSVSLYLKYIGIGVYGVLALFDNPYFGEQMIAVLISNVSIVLWVTMSSYLEDERKLLLFKVNISGTSTIICCFGALASTIIRFPTLNFSMESRFVTLLPGGAWNHVAMIFMIFLWISMRKLYSKFVVGICIGWFMLHYERVDILGFIIMAMLLFCVRKNYRINYKFITKYMIVIIVLPVLFIYLGEARENYQQNFFSDFLMKVLNQKTSSDVSYTFVAAFKYVRDFGYANGKTFLYYLYNAIPILDETRYDAAIILAQRYGTAYGSYILNEAYMNWGWVGIVIVPNLYMLCLRMIVSKRKPYNLVLYIYIIASSFRIIWYGLSYIETGVLYILPLTYFVVYLFNGRRSLKYEQ